MGYDKEIKLKSRKISTDEKRGLVNLLTQMSNDLESRKIIEQVREICSELAYRNYFIQIAVQHLITISDTNTMNNWARTLQQLDWILEFANQFSKLYKLNFEAQMEINSADRIMKWLTMLFRHSVINLNPEKSNEILDNIKIDPSSQTPILLKQFEKFVSNSDNGAIKVLTV